MGMTSMTKMVKTLINHKWELLLPDFRASKPEWGFWEKERLAAMYNAIRPGDIILDIGAEQGDMSCLFSLWGAKVILVEPSQGFWPNMKATFEANKQQPLAGFQVLASNEDLPWPDRQPYMGLNDEWPQAARGELNDDVGFSHLSEKPKIPVVRIDTLVHPNWCIDVITCDCEGSEYAIIEGARDVIMRDKPILFISVHSEMMWREHHNTPDDLHVMLDSWGYDATYLAFDHEAHWMYKPRPEKI